MTPDNGNAVFEFGGFLFQCMNVARLWRDRQVRGAYWPAWMFFTARGYWNMFYYPSLHQWWSFAAGLLLAASNTAWVALAWHWRKR